jgi:DNA-directed RNA polymerase subunit E'/Rpb7
MTSKNSTKKSKNNSNSEILNDTEKNSTKKSKNNSNSEILINTEKNNIIENVYNSINNNLHNPFIKTILSTPIMISPDQMDNKMYIHLKSNLKNKLEGKCYENYGYIDKIYNIEEISDGFIEPEDSSCSAKMEVKFSCNLFLPIVEKEIICKIDRMNKALIMAVNGPIKVIITSDKINKDKFFTDINRNIRVKGSSEVVLPNMYLRVLILSKSFSNYDENILVIGFLQDIALQKDVDEYMIKYFNKSDNIPEINYLLEN